MTRLVRLLAPALLCLAAIPCLAQATGEVGAAAGVVESGGPDVSHRREGALADFSLWGALATFDKDTALALEWRDLGSPESFLRAAAFRPRWQFEATAVRRSYLADGGARFAWDPRTGALNGGALPILGQYAHDPTGSPLGRFAPETILALRDTLPQSAPAWRQDDVELRWSTRSKEWGLSFGLSASLVESTLPRSFVTSTGFTPFYIPFFLDGPVGDPLGILEVPERQSQRYLSADLKAFQKVGAWRWEESLASETFRLRRPVTLWANPFPGPVLEQPGRSTGEGLRGRLSGRSKELWLSADYDRRTGEGDAGRRTLGTTRLRAGLDHPFSETLSLYAEAGWKRRSDAASVSPQGPHPIFQGPYYDAFLGPYDAPGEVRIYPYREWSTSAGLRSRWFSVGLQGLDGVYENRFGHHRRTLDLVLSARPVKGLEVTYRPGWVRVSELDPEADTLVTLLDTERQAGSFLPADARNWRKEAVTIRYQRGGLLLEGSHQEAKSSRDPGLKARRGQELHGSWHLSRGPYQLWVSGRWGWSDLELAGTNYAAFTDPRDPLDPSHRLALDDRWSRRGAGASLSLERESRSGLTWGGEGRWSREHLFTRSLLDSGRAFSYWTADLYGSRAWGALSLRVEAGYERYASEDPLYRPASVSGPTLWAGLTERPGGRAYAALRVGFKF